MNNFIKTSYATSTVIFILYLSAFLCNGEEVETVGAPMEKREKEALYSAIQGFVGKWWNGSDLYPDPCGWTPIQGVSCDMFDDYWYVTTLNIGLIHDNSLGCASNMEFRPQLFALTHLKTLSFVNCMVHKRHPITIPIQNWGALGGSLESLEFRSNPSLIGQIPTTFGGLTKLQSLVLLENGLSGELPTNIGNLINLKRLVLCGNLFTGEVPVNFGGLSELLIMDLSRNSLSGNLPNTLGGLSSLLKLDLSNNKLVGNIPNEIGNMKNLTLLDLSNNKFLGGLTKSLQELSSLEELVLSNNPICGGLMRLEWHNLQGLIILDLSNMGLTGGVPESMAELKGLRFLGLNDNNLTGDLSPKLAALPNVGAIYVNGNNLSGELKFSELFYGKMGRRFGAWDNPNLCYPIGLVSTGRVPFGVKPCEEKVNNYGTKVETNSKLGNGNGNGNGDQNSYSGEYSSSRMDGIWYVYVVKILIVVLLNFSM